jgi:hypothetical protein
MHLAHRRSVDLDLFRAESFDADAMVRELRAAGVPLDSIATSRSTVHAVVGEVRTSFLSFPYPLLEATHSSQEGVAVAGLADIAAMKIEAIASRGARKDFYDLYFICDAGLSLRATVAAFERKFASAHPDLYHRLRALTYFDDAEVEPEPILLRPVAWPNVRRFFEEQVRAIWRQA